MVIYSSWTRFYLKKKIFVLLKVMETFRIAGSTLCKLSLLFGLFVSWFFLALFCLHSLDLCMVLGIRLEKQLTDLSLESFTKGTVLV